jgi:multidrug efflux pump subunit AcrB
MNLIAAALRRPFTVLVAIVAITLGSFLAVGGAICDQLGIPYPSGLPRGMEVDIFPSLNLPVIYVCQPYGGMDPAQMEGFLTNYYEYHFLYISGIHHVESRNVQGTALMKLFFHPGTDMSQAMAETINYVNRSQAFMPPGTVSPFVMRFDTGSVPVGYLVLSSETRSIAEIQDLALFHVLEPAGRVGATAVRRQRAERGCHGRSAAAAVVRHVTGRGDHRAGEGQLD